MKTAALGIAVLTLILGADAAMAQRAVPRAAPGPRPPVVGPQPPIRGAPGPVAAAGLPLLAGAALAAAVLRRRRRG